MATCISVARLMSTLQFCEMKMMERFYSVIILLDRFRQPKAVWVFHVHVGKVTALRVRQLQGWGWQPLRIRGGPGGIHTALKQPRLQLLKTNLQTWATMVSSVTNWRTEALQSTRQPPSLPPRGSSEAPIIQTTTRIALLYLQLCIHPFFPKKTAPTYPECCYYSLH